MSGRRKSCCEMVKRKIRCYGVSGVSALRRLSRPSHPAPGAKPAGSLSQAARNSLVGRRRSVRRDLAILQPGETDQLVLFGRCLWGSFFFQNVYGAQKYNSNSNQHGSTLPPNDSRFF